MKQTHKAERCYYMFSVKGSETKAIFYNVRYLNGGISVFCLKFGCSDRKSIHESITMWQRLNQILAVWSMSLKSDQIK